ncbi:NAD(P)-binding protein [Auriscalpium vulgare]|uniref:NAD(P)-binding protein n=1 Tax=Auriscalpium vulgare TaxID=40419 RepID=A0ACB8RFJ9_9AGAM|nr:NAD(P)-binding protein [Auriscalpium vulgare]
MPIVNSGTILVTGGSGYIGAWVIKYLVDDGYNVVAAVRNPAQGEFIVNRFPEYKGKVTSIVVPDITKEGAFDDAVKNADGIVHAASPVVFEFEDPEEVIGPAVNGATGILKSAAKYGPNVKRVIITSAVASINREPVDRVYDENDWNLKDLDAVHTKDSPGWAVYHTAKVRAEKAAYAYVEAAKPQYDLITLLPAMNWGPYLHQPGKNFGTSPGYLLDTWATPDTSGQIVNDYVDVRDVAMLHVLSLKNKDIGGERLITVYGEPFAWQDIYDILNEAGYDAPGKDTRGAGKNKHLKVYFSSAKTFKFFPDFKYRALKESVLDMAVDLKKGGYLN